MTAQRVLRALVALDPSEPNDYAVELLARLSGGGPVELLGLLVEDINVHRFADLPFASEIHLATGTVRALDRQRLTRQFRAQATRVRSRFESTALRLKMHYSFRVERGEVVAEVRRAAVDADVLVVGRSSGRSYPRSWHGRTIHRLATDTAHTVVFAQGSWRHGRSVLVLYDGSEAARSLLRTGARLAAREGIVLTVLTVDTPRADDLRADAERVLRPLDIGARFRHLPAADAGLLARVADQEDSRLLLLPAEHPVVSEELIQELLELAPCSLVLGR